MYVQTVKYALDQNPLEKKEKITVSNFLHTNPKKGVD